jgi:hypothetical protein
MKGFAVGKFRFHGTAPNGDEELEPRRKAVSANEPSKTREPATTTEADT